MNIITSLNKVEPFVEVFLSYLPDDILVKVDRAAIGVCLETRVPRLDHRAFEFALSSPLAYELRDGSTKWSVGQVFHRHLPRKFNRATQDGL
jgi:asparagine synthase (glutamine-hydrolysing)